MLEYLIVGLIVVAASLYVFKKYLPKSLRARLFGKASRADGCGDGCGSCGTGCATGTADPEKPRVVRIHPR